MVTRAAVPKLAGLGALVAAVIYAAVGSKSQTIAGLTGQQLAAMVAAALAGLHLAPAVKKAKPKPKPAPADRLTTMWDAVTITNVPTRVQAFAAYIDGRFANLAGARARFKGARIVTIAVHPDADADWLDIETGDALPQDFPAWAARQRRRGVKRPGAYGSLSTMAALAVVLRRAGISVSSIKRWVANPTTPPHPHIPPGYDGCQYEFGGGFDKSLCHSSFFE